MQFNEGGVEKDGAQIPFRIESEFDYFSIPCRKIA